jgi:DNA-binding NarL/FixJ family response regulator
VRIVIVEDNALLREGVVALLRERGLDVVADAEDAPAFLDAVRAHEPDLAIVDVRLAPTELLRDGAGGVGYLLKERVGDVRAFLDAIERVAEGGTALDREVVAELVRDRLGSAGEQGLDALTPREREVLELMAEGRTNTAIARALGVRVGAVEKHVSGVFAKLGLPAGDDDHRRVLAVLAYLREGR